MSWVPDGDPWLSDTHHLWPAPNEAQMSRAGSKGPRARGCGWRLDGRQPPPLYLRGARARARGRWRRVRRGPQDIARRVPRPSTRRATRFSSRSATIYTLRHPGATSDSGDRLSEGAKLEATFSPDGRSVAFIKNNNIFVASSTASGEKALTIGRQRHAAQRHARLGVFGRALRPRQSSRLLVEPGLVAHRVPAVRRTRRAGIHADRRHPVSPDGRALELSEGRRPESDGPARRRLAGRRACALDRHDQVHRLPHRQRRLDAGQPRRSCIRSRTARRRGSTSTAPIASNGADAERAQGNEQGVGRAMAGSERRSDLAEGRLVSVAERAQRLAAFLSLRRRRHADPAGHAAANGKSGAHTASIRAGTWVYFSSTTHSPIGLDLYRIRIDGTGMQRLSTTAGRHRAFFNPSRTLFLDSWSDVTTPPQVRLHRTGARDVVRVVDANPVPPLEGIRVVDAGVAAGENARRLRHGSDDDQAAGLRSRRAAIRSISSPTAGRTRSRS